MKNEEIYKYMCQVVAQMGGQVTLDPGQTNPEQACYWNFIVDGIQFSAGSRWGEKDKLRVSLSLPRKWRHNQHKTVSAAVSIGRNIHQASKDLIRRVITPGKKTYFEARRQNHQFEAKQQLERAETESLLNELGVSLSEVGPRDSWRNELHVRNILITHYETGPTFQSCTGGYNFTARDVSEHALRQILRILRADYELQQHYASTQKKSERRPAGNS